MPISADGSRPFANRTAGWMCGCSTRLAGKAYSQAACALEGNPKGRRARVHRPACWAVIPTAYRRIKNESFLRDLNERLVIESECYDLCLDRDVFTHERTCSGAGCLPRSDIGTASMLGIDLHSAPRCLGRNGFGTSQAVNRRQALASPASRSREPSICSVCNRRRSLAG